MKRIVLAAALPAAVAIVAAVWLVSRDDNGASRSVGLPETPDYHALHVDPADARRLLLGTHAGLHVSTDGGRTWREAGLGGQDAMNIAGGGKRAFWVAGHNVFTLSRDGGETWTDVRPLNLTSLDIHGFALDPRTPKSVYAAIAGEGLYQSFDSGRTFELLSQDVGRNVLALAVQPDGRILAGDLDRGLLASDNEGLSWRRLLDARIVDLAVHPRQPQVMLAAGLARLLLTEDGGHSWRPVLALPYGAGPVAWSSSRPNLVYAVSFDRRLYRSADGGRSWRVVV